MHDAKGQPDRSVAFHGDSPSIVEGVVWPPIASPTAARMLALEHQLNTSQWWSAADIETAQFRQLEQLTSHALGTVPFYRRLVETGRIPRKFVPTPQTWRDLPILMREQVSGAGNQLLSTATPKEHGKLGKVETTGSTGTPVTVVGTEASRAMWLALGLRDVTSHGWDLSQKLAVIRHDKAASNELRASRSPHWGFPAAAAYTTGPSVSLNSLAPIATQVEWLKSEAPTYLITLASLAHEIATYCLEHNVTLPTLRGIKTIFEVLRDETRHRVEQAFGVSVVDAYSAQETGYLALECPQGKGLHVQCESVYFELLNDRMQPCTPGETGQVVVTPLHNYAMPLLRYAIGDFATAGPPCSCGRGAPILSSVLGRTRDVVPLPDGRRHAPNFQGLLSGLSAIRQIQVVLRADGNVEIRLAAQRPLDTQEAATLTERIHARFLHPFPVEFSYHNAIAREPGGKYRDFIVEN